MNSRINMELEEFFKDADNSSLIKDLIKYKESVLNNSELLAKIDQLKKINNKFSEEYKTLKLEIYEYKDYNKYISLENELNMLIMGINSKLRDLIRK